MSSAKVSVKDLPVLWRGLTSDPCRPRLKAAANADRLTPTLHTMTKKIAQVQGSKQALLTLTRQPKDAGPRRNWTPTQTLDQMRHMTPLSSDVHRPWLHFILSLLYISLIPLPRSSHRESARSDYMSDAEVLAFIQVENSTKRISGEAAYLVGILDSAKDPRILRVSESILWRRTTNRSQGRANERELKPSGWSGSRSLLAANGSPNRGQTCGFGM